MVSRLTPIHSSNDMHKYFGLLNVQKHLLSILNEAFKSDMYFAVKIGRQKMYFSPLMHFLRTSSPRCCTFSPSSLCSTHHCHRVQGRLPYKEDERRCTSLLPWSHVCSRSKYWRPWARPVVDDQI
jgi:hypothetical protein